MIGPIGLALIVTGSVMAVGTVHVPVLLVFALLTVTLAGTLAWLHADQRRVPAPAWLMVALAGYSLLQAAPLPLSWLEAIAPTTADVWLRSLLPMQQHPSVVALSLDPGATLVEALKWLTYAHVLYIACVVVSRRGADTAVAIVFGSALLVALVALAHDLAGASKLFGIYRPDNPVPRIAPLLNANNLAGYLNLGAFCGAALMFMRRPLVPRWLCGVGVAGVLAIAMRTGSRAGLAALAIGVVLLAVLLQRRSSNEGNRSWKVPAIAGGATLITGAVLAVLGGDAGILAELTNENLGKLRLAAWSRPLLVDFPWFGIGRGAFESVFKAYQPYPRANVIYTHPENFAVQWVAEWGLVVGLVALLGFAWMYRPWKFRVTQSALAAGSWVGMLVLLLHNLLDLGLEVPAVGIAAATVLGSLWGNADAGRSGAPAADGSRTRAISTLVAPPAVAVVTSILVVAWGLHTVEADRKRILAELDRLRRGASSPPSAFHDSLRTAIQRHPADYYFPLVGARWAWGQRQDPIPWLQRTLERAPMAARAHLLLAQVLADRGARRQALFELRLAAEYERELAGSTAPIAIKMATTYDELLLAVPPGSPGTLVLDTMAAHLQASGRRELRELCDREALTRNPDLHAPRLRLAEDRLAALSTKEPRPPCNDRAPCEKEVETQAEALRRLRPLASTADQLVARMLVTRGDSAAAVELLDRACALPEERPGCLMLRMELTAKSVDPSRLDALVRDFLSSSCMDAAACARAYSWAGDFRMSRGELNSAAAAFARAAREEPTEPRLLRAAEMAERAGMHVQAVELLEGVSRARGGADTDIKDRISRNRAAAAALIR